MRCWVPGGKHSFSHRGFRRLSGGEPVNKPVIKPLEQSGDAGVCVEDFGAQGHRQQGGRERELLAGGRCEADEILFGGEQSGGAPGAPGDGAELMRTERVVIAEGEGGLEVDAGRSQAREKLARVGDSAEGDGASLHCRRNEAPAHAPDRGADARVGEGGGGGGIVFAQNEEAGAAQRGERLAEAAGGQEAAGGVAGVVQMEVGVAGELAVLEAIIEQVNAGFAHG